MNHPLTAVLHRARRARVTQNSQLLTPSPPNLFTSLLASKQSLLCRLVYPPATKGARMRFRIVALSLLALLSAGAAAAQSDWDSHTRTGEYAFARGDFPRAEAEFRAALEIAQKLPAGDPKLEVSLDNLARFYENRSDFDRALPLYQLELAAAEMRVGDDDPALLPMLLAVARTAQPMGEVPTVEKSLTRYAQIAEASGAADPDPWWAALSMLARMEAIQERPEEALRWQRRAVEVLEDATRPTDAERADAKETLAHMEIVAGNGDEAETLLVEVARLRTAEDGTDGTGATMAEGAAVAYGAGEMETAESLADLALDDSPNSEAELAARRVLADVSWARVGRGTDNLDVLLAAASESQELELASQRLAALEALQNPPDRETFARLVQVEALRGRPAEAAKWQRRILDLPLAQADALAAREDLVLLLAAAGELDQALAENAEILAALDAQYGPDDRRLAPVLQQRIDLLTRAGNKKEAKQVRKRLKKLTR